MARRIHVPSLKTGEILPFEILLDESQAHHLRDVLRLKAGATVELFDDAGITGDAIVTRADPSGVTLNLESIRDAQTSGELIIASAVPKGDRADWMIEKLSELGVTRFIPLKTERSVVHPTGSGKRDRWLRIATESAKQSRRAGVMQIDELTHVRAVCDRGGTFFLSTADDAVEIREIVERPTQLTLLIGPEGGWSDGEIALFNDARLTGIKLTATILRVETAAIAAAAIAATLILRH